MEETSENDPMEAGWHEVNEDNQPSNNTPVSDENDNGDLIAAVRDLTAIDGAAGPLSRLLESVVDLVESNPIDDVTTLLRMALDTITEGGRAAA